MSYPNAGFSYGDHRAGFELITTLFQHADQKIRELFGFQPFDADANHRRPRRARKGQLGVKIRVQGNDDLRMVPSSREDGAAGGSRKANFADVVGFQARVAQVEYGRSR